MSSEQLVPESKKQRREDDSTKQAENEYDESSAQTMDNAKWTAKRIAELTAQGEAFRAQKGAQEKEYVKLRAREEAREKEYAKLRAEGEALENECAKLRAEGEAQGEAFRAQNEAQEKEKAKWRAEREALDKAGSVKDWCLSTSFWPSFCCFWPRRRSGQRQPSTRPWTRGLQVYVDCLALS
jgi:chromosome segregation ATPase